MKHAFRIAVLGIVAGGAVTVLAGTALAHGPMGNGGWQGPGGHQAHGRMMGGKMGAMPDRMEFGAGGLATATFGGATALLARSGEKPGALVAQVASKGGTTQAGLDIIDEGVELVALMTNVLRAARDRGRELADLARGED